MSVINNAHPGSHIPTLCLLDRILNRALLNKKDESIPAQDILDNYSPEQLFKSDEIIAGQFKTETNPQKKLKETISFWSEFPLWNVENEGIKSKSPLNNEGNLPYRLLQSIFYKKHDILNGTKIEPLIVALCVLFSIDECVLLGGKTLTSSSVTTLINSYLPKYLDEEEKIRLSLNSSDASGLLAYASLLGFTEELSSSESIIDTSKAIKGMLGKLYHNDEKSISIQVFIQRLNSHIPLFDNSEYRNIVEDLMVEHQTSKVKFERKASDQISASLGFALYRLSVEGYIYLDAASDADYRVQFELPEIGIIYVSDVRLVEKV